jgi:hypothetical protein
MGTLVVWYYPTALFANQADHTYVACGTGGKAWSCWGGKTGGTALRQGTGSTLRADAIAEPDERANVKCYLVNGVCHQAANRILLPAQITVRGVRGYWVSEALYGTYGRPRGFLGFCEAPFHQHPEVAGDLPACVPPPGEPEAAVPADVSGREAAERFGAAAAPEAEEEPGMEQYLARVRSLYAEVEPMVASAALTEDAAQGFQMSLFELMTDYRLGEGYRATAEGRELMGTRANLEAERLELERAFFLREMTTGDFVRAYNRLMIDFQARTAEVLPADRFTALLAVAPEEPMVLGDPEVARLAYPGR